MTLLYYHPLFLEHQTGAHPERAQRLRQVAAHLERTGLDRRCRRPDWAPASLERLSRIHAPEYLTELAEFARRGGGRIEMDTVVGPKSYDVAIQAAGAVCDAVCRVVRGADSQALCLVRPPGHHALGDGAMGFCLLNNVALGAAVAIGELELDRVLIVDWDVHHGNGTQNAFWESERVGFYSIHRWPFYPGTGRADDTGSGPGLGTTLNVPVEMGTPRRAYIDLFRSNLERFAAKIRPQLVLVSAGFDSHRDDPVGSLGLETEDFLPLTEAVLDVSADCCGGKLVSVLEGGYNPGILAGSVETHLRALLDHQEKASRQAP